jgi:tetratricopeptide (TPR) repeat protein
LAPTTPAVPDKLQNEAQTVVTSFLDKVDAARLLIEKGDLKTASAQVDGLKIPALPPAETSLALAGRGGLYAGLGKDAAAEADFRSAVSADPSNRDALRALARRLQASGRPAEALIYENHLILSQPEGLNPEEKARAYVERAQIEAELKKWDRAESDLKTGLGLAPDEAASLKAAAAYWVGRGKPAEAVSYADRLVKQANTPENRGRALNDRARLEMGLKEYGKAEADLRQALAIDAKDAVAARGLTDCLAAQGRAAEAEKFASGTDLAQLQTGRKEYDKAEATLKGLLQADPVNLQALAAMAGLLTERGRADEALKFADRAVAAAGPDKASSLIGRAAILMGKKEFAKAEPDLRAALKEPRAEPDARFLLSISLERQGRPKEALAVLDQAGSTDAPARFLLERFVAAAAAGNRPAADEALRKAIAADGMHTCQTGLPYYGRSELDLLYFDFCVKEFPKDARLLTDRGIARFTRGQAEGSIEDLTAALKEQPDALEAAMSLSSVYQSQGGGQVDKAREVLSKALAAAGKRKKEPVYATAMAMQTSLSSVK